VEIKTKQAGWEGHDLDGLDRNFLLPGVLKVFNDTLEWADANALKILACNNDIFGRPIEEVLPNCSIFRGKQKEVVSQVVELGNCQVLVTSIMSETPMELRLIILHQLDAEMITENIPRTEIYKEIDHLLESIHNDVLIADGKGVIVRVNPSFEEIYGITEEEAVGQTVFEMEKREVFVPSVTAMVLKQKQKLTIVQENRKGRKIVVRAVPVFNERNEIERVVSYSQDITDYLALKDQYEKLEELMKRYSSEIRELREKEVFFPEFVGKSPKMKQVLGLAMKVASVESTVLLTGESGVGKNLIARLIHQKSDRNEGPFIEINCGAIPENLLESELFGYEEGAFSGANREGKFGKIELAQNGTLFLDEIGELPLSLQVKILKVIQEKSLTKIGGTKQIKVDFRLISATNKDLETLVREKQFREDLYYRLNVVPINIPPLRERREDILPLMMQSLKETNSQYQKEKSLCKDAVDILLSYGWPGNVRELKNVMERLVVTADDDVIRPSGLPDNFQIPAESNSKVLPLREAVELLEKELVQKAYERYPTSVGVAKVLGISQPTAARKLRKHLGNYSKMNK